jgi:hypothetical protein
MKPVTKDILTKASELINQYGWVQGTSGNKGIGFCAFGAIAEASTELYPNTKWEELDTIEGNAIKTVSRFADGSIIGYNDEPNRTKEEVLLAFQKAINSENNI